ncbi:MAG: hypothetical protein CSB46_04115 [Micrococcales bacterium]|nr:MAG: hypothetical protein CSB46_04115 [Micrococcales bacterium]
MNMAATDVMGLVAQGFVRVYNPVDRRGNNLARSQVRNMRIDAAVLSVQNSFTVQNYHRGRRLGNLTVAGGIYQNHRGPVGTSSRPSTGYFKNYLYDTRLRSLPPPHFLNPVGSAWGVAGFSEG